MDDLLDRRLGEGELVVGRARGSKGLVIGHAAACGVNGGPEGGRNRSGKYRRGARAAGADD